MPEPSEPSNPSAAELVAQYLKNVRGAVPLAIEQIETILGLINAARDRVEDFLDLGCGDGVITIAILAEHPESRAVVVDLVPGPTGVARSHFNEFSGRVSCTHADIAYPTWIDVLDSEVKFDAIVSAFALQPLADDRKQALYCELFRLLRPEGVFLNIEHVASATRWTESVWDDTMITALFGSVIQEHPDMNRAEIAREYYEKARSEANRCAPFEVQIDWLRAAGFINVDCYLKVLELALFGGQKPAAVPR
jgi:ubiquinone/menaquinone biosynthesis C-methylase UbiE